MPGHTLDTLSELLEKKKLMMKIAFMIIAPGISQTQREARSVNTSEQISIKVDCIGSITTFSIIFQAPPAVGDTIQYRSTAAKMASFLKSRLGRVTTKGSLKGSRFY